MRTRAACALLIRKWFIGRLCQTSTDEERRFTECSRGGARDIDGQLIRVSE